MDIKVKAFIDEHEKWKNELLLLRKILLELGLSEQYKWRVPVFLHEGKNIIRSCIAEKKT